MTTANTVSRNAIRVPVLFEASGSDVTEVEAAGPGSAPAAETTGRSDRAGTIQAG